jgi:hypothetical protein
MSTAVALSFHWYLFYIYFLIQFLTYFNFHLNRLKVQHRSENDATSRTQLAVVVARFPFTFKSRHVHPADTHPLK